MVHIGLDIVSMCLAASVFVFSVSTRKILAHGAIFSLNLPVKSIPPPAPVARRREIARQQIDVSVPVVSVPNTLSTKDAAIKDKWMIQERRYGQYSF